MSNSVYCRLPTRRHIRLLSLLPLSSGPELSVSINSHLIDSVPQYEALSYVWGEEHGSILIRCNRAFLAVTRSLFSALQHIRTPEGLRVMWIDAICINQDDPDERSLQVTLMREIYLRAHAVTIWLGPGRTYTAAAWETMQHIGTIYQEVLQKKDEEVDWYARQLLPNMAVSDLPMTNSQASLEIDDLNNIDVCSEIKQILSHPWFTRSWVVQEAACARHLSICCGELSMTWATLRSVCCFMREQQVPEMLQNAWQIANSMILLQDTLRTGVDTLWPPLEDEFDPVFIQPDQILRTLLPATRHLLATDPRDKIFAFLGLCKPEVRELKESGFFDRDEQLKPWSTDEIALTAQDKLPLVPNYSIDIGTLYCAIMKRLLTKDLFILCHAAQTACQEDLPSWVADWRTKVEMIVLGRVEVVLTETRAGNSGLRRDNRETGTFRPFQASPGYFKLNTQTHLHILELQGRCLDTIKELRTDIWLTDVWDASGRLGDEEIFQEFLERVGHFMMKEYSPERAYRGSKHASLWQDEWPDSFRHKQYNVPAFSNQCNSFQETTPGVGERSSLVWPAQGYLQDYLRIQTANLRLSDSEFRPGHPGWHYLSTYISPSGSRTRGGPVHITSEPMPRIIPPGYFIFAARVRIKRKIFCTTKGFIGICPEWAKPGDSLCFIDGGHVPFVLRAVGDGYFRLVGESYCHGMMSGQIAGVVKEKTNFLLV